MARAIVLMLRLVLTPLLAGAALVAFLLVLAAALVRESILDAELYTGALAATGTYERLYSELLQDPSSTGTTGNLLGGEAGIPHDEAERLLRQVLLPEYLQSQVEANVPAVIAYLKKDTAVLSITLDLGPVLENIAPVAVAFVAQRLSMKTVEPAPDFATYSATLAEAVAEVEAGGVPAAVPGFELTVAEQLAAAGLILGARPATDEERAAVEDALAASDTRAALVAAVRPLLQPRVDSGIVALRTQLLPGDRLDLVAKAAEGRGQTREEYLADLDETREIASFLDRWALWSASGVLLVLVGLLGALYLPGWRRAARVAGAALMVLGLGGLAGFLVVRATVPGAVHAAVIESHGSSSASARLMAADLAREIAHESSGSLWPPALVAVLVGALLVALPALRGRGAPAGANGSAGDAFESEEAGAAGI